MSPVRTTALSFKEISGNNSSLRTWAKKSSALPPAYSPFVGASPATASGRTLREIGSHIALEMREVPTGTEVFDWTIPREWNIRDAYIRDGEGAKVVDFAQSNLHVMSYSIPVRKRAIAGRAQKARPHAA